MKGTCLIKTHDVIPQVGTTCSSHDFNPSKVLAELNADLAHLKGQFSCWHHYHGYIETKMGRSHEMQELVEKNTVTLIEFNFIYTESKNPVKQRLKRHIYIG